MVGQLRFFGTVGIAAVLFVLLLPVHLANLRLKHGSVAVAQLWQRCVCRLIGVRVQVTGVPAKDRPLLILSNHVSWLDIPVLASAAPVSFIAKKEVASWPVVGFLARAQRTVFVDRERRNATGAKAEEVAGRLRAGHIIVLFAEGTSTDGNRVLPFRSALVGSAQRALPDSGTASVQPVAIVYRRILGLPIGRQHRPLVAWFGGADLLPHLRRVLSHGGIDVEVVFGPVASLGPADDRKAVTAAAGTWVRQTVTALNAGRNPSPHSAPIPHTPFPLQKEDHAPIEDLPLRTA